MVKRKHLTTRVEAPIKKQVEEIAVKERRTISQVVSLLIIEALQARQSKGQAA